MPKGTSQSIAMGVLLRRVPGVTRWAKWHWHVSGLIVGAAPSDWQELRQDGDTVEFVAGGGELTLWSGETEAYLTALSDTPPSVYAILRDTGDAVAPFEVALVTASPFEAQDHADNAEDLVEKLPMPPGLIAWVEEFVARHHHDEAFVKRRRDKKRVDVVEDGRGDPRIPQLADVFRSPASARKARVS